MEEIPQVSVRLSHGEIEVKPDAEGQMRELDVDVVLELDIRLYEEKEETFDRDMYSNSSKLIPETKTSIRAADRQNVCKPTDRGGENTSGGSQNAFYRSAIPREAFSWMRQSLRKTVC